MAFRKLPTLGRRPQDVADGLERLKDEVSKTETVSEYTIASGSNSVAHGMKQIPRGRYIVWCTCATITDVSLTDRLWTFTASGAGTIKVIWL